MREVDDGARGEAVSLRDSIDAALRAYSRRQSWVGAQIPPHHLDALAAYIELRVSRDLDATLRATFEEPAPPPDESDELRAAYDVIAVLVERLGQGVFVAADRIGRAGALTITPQDDGSFFLTTTNTE